MKGLPMKKFLSLFISISFILTPSLICGSKNDTKDSIYKTNKEWKFSVNRTDAKSIDTAILIVTEKPGNKGEKLFKWILITNDPTMSKKEIDTSLVEISGNDESTFIEIPSPSSRYFRFTAAVPSPKIRLPLYIGYTMTSKTTFTITDIEEIKDQPSKGKLEVANKIYYNNQNIKDTCWAINAVGESKLGTFKAKYYYHVNSGFVYFLYDFNKYKIEMELISFESY
jgi:hypothetical protein